MKLRFTVPAEAALSSALDYLFDRNPAAALRFAEDVHRARGRIPPVLGHRRRRGRQSRCNAADALLGFGASAIGQLPGGYVQNAVPVNDYARRIAENGVATAKGIALGAEDLRSHIEDVYGNWYLAELGNLWTSQAEAELLPAWHLPNIINQYDFFAREVQPVLDAEVPGFAILACR